MTLFSCFLVVGSELLEVSVLAAVLAVALFIALCFLEVCARIEERFDGCKCLADLESYVSLDVRRAALTAFDAVDEVVHRRMKYGF